MDAAFVDVRLAGATARFTGRAGGVSGAPYDTLNLGPATGDDPAAVRRNLSIASDGRPVARLRQVHGSDIRTAVPADTGADLREGDGLVTTSTGIALAAMTADCLPVVLATSEVIAVVHAGWRGLAAGVVENGVAAMRDLDRTGEIRVALGPGAGACCYEVGPEVAARFPEDASGRFVDLKAAARRRLAAAGVALVHDVNRCTMCEADVFFSHRRSGPVTGRQAGLVWR